MPTAIDALLPSKRGSKTGYSTKVKKVTFSLLLFCLVYGVYENRPVEVNVIGKVLFRHLCLVELWAHTLTGAKPCTFTGYRKPCVRDLLRHPLWYFADLRLLWRWETWLKYQHYFSRSRFQIFEDPDPAWKDHLCLVVIDTDHFAQVIVDWESDFKLVLGGDSIDPTQFLIERRNRAFFQRC